MSFFKATEKTNYNNDNNANEPWSSNVVNRTVNSNHVNIVEKTMFNWKAIVISTPR